MGEFVINDAANTEIRFDGRVVVITGAARGLGRAHAELIGSRGAKLVVNDVRGAVETVAELRERGIEAVADTNDISTAEGAAALIAAATDNFGRLDAVINNAAILRMASVTEQPDEFWHDSIRINLTGTYYVSRAAWPVFVAQGYGRLVNTASAAGMFGVANNVSYNASKGGVYGLTRGLAAEGEPLGIKVNAIAPGAFTPMAEEFALSPEMKKQLQESMPVGLNSPVVAILAHEDCPVTGRLIEAGAGRVGEIFVGDTIGIYDRSLTPESLLDAWDKMVDKSEYRLPKNGEEAMALVALAAERAKRS